MKIMNVRVKTALYVSLAFLAYSIVSFIIEALTNRTDLNIIMAAVILCPIIFGVVWVLMRLFYKRN